MPSECVASGMDVWMQAKRQIAKQLKDMSMNIRAQNLEAIKALPPAPRPAVKEQSPFERAKAYSRTLPKPKTYDEVPIREETSNVSSLPAASPELVMLEHQHAMDQQTLDQMRGMQLTAA